MNKEAVVHIYNGMLLSHTYACTVVLEKTPENFFGQQGIKPVNPKGNQP